MMVTPEEILAPGYEMPVGWIGVDLDGTLAHYDGWKGIDHIGPPIVLMRDRILRWLSEGRQVKIFTARATTPAALPFIERWLLANGLPALEVTNIKDYYMDELWDDRCVNVGANTGMNSHPSPRGLCEWTWP